MGGGTRNNAFGDASVVSGGQDNTAWGFAGVSAGLQNAAVGYGSSVGGGEQNYALGSLSSVGGGFGNTAMADFVTIGGGSGHSSIGHASVIGGGIGNAAGGTETVVAGGVNNAALASLVTIGGGEGNTGNGDYSTIAGGQSNRAQAYWSTVSGGNSNVASNSGATVAGGTANSAHHTYAAISGGSLNQISGSFGAIAGGTMNTVAGTMGFIGGGGQNYVGGEGSAALGSDAYVTHDSAVVLSFDDSGACNSMGDNTAHICAPNGLFVNGVEFSGGASGGSGGNDSARVTAIEEVLASLRANFTQHARIIEDAADAEFWSLLPTNVSALVAQAAASEARINIAETQLTASLETLLRLQHEIGDVNSTAQQARNDGVRVESLLSDLSTVVENMSFNLSMQSSGIAELRLNSSQSVARVQNSLDVLQHNVSEMQSQLSSLLRSSMFDTATTVPPGVVSDACVAAVEQMDMTLYPFDCEVRCL